MSDEAAAAPEAVRIGATIQALREAHGLSRSELARAIGRSEQLIGAIERGQRRAIAPVCRRIADTLGIPLAAITIESYEAIRELT